MSKKNLIILIIVLVLGGMGIWFFYFQFSAPVPDQAANTDTALAQTWSNPAVQQIESELVDLRRLKNLHLDTSILQSPFLKSLEAPRTLPKDTGTTTPGRANPFLPF